jgi:hypothetical protein|tara:strand:- start:92 stop:484 length:393 start_codon:yes stop_codon:yes gene_type:complete
MKFVLLILLAVGDFSIFLLFVIFGKSEHDITLSQSYIRTVIPFSIAWFTISPLLGAYRFSTIYKFRKSIFKIPIIWIMSGIVAIIIRSFILDRSIVISFVIVSILVQGILLIGWRFIFILITKIFKHNFE